MRAFVGLRPIGPPWAGCALLLAGCALLLTGCAVPERGESDAPGLVPAPLFADIAAESGLSFHHFLGASGEFFFPETAAAGVALLDFDADGDLDVFLPQGVMLDRSKGLDEAQFAPPKEHWPGDRLFRNDPTEQGPRFVDVSTEAGVAATGYGMGVAVGDYDNDGEADLYVTRFGANTLYRNEGDGSFTDVTARAGVDDPRWSSSSTFLDYDRDGDLDLFVTNYVDFTVAGARPCAGPAGQRDYCGPLTYEPLPDRLFRNEGGDVFTDVTAAAGLHAAFGSGLGVVARDLNGDGWTDLYVANDQRPNQLWRNRGDGGFDDVALIAGTAYNLDGAAEASMGVAVEDIDNDGDDDLLVTHLEGETNTLYVNQGGGTFVDATNERGLAASSRPHTGFGVTWIDFDHDGYLDLYVANGSVKVVDALRGTPYPFQQKNQLLRNRGDGRFEDVSALGGPALELFEVSRGVAQGDIDGDGDLDLVVSNCNGPARLLRNELPAGGNWLSVATGAGAASAIGARAHVTTREGASLWRSVRTDGSYLSAHDHRVHFGLSSSVGAEVEVYWPDGGRTRWPDTPANRTVRGQRRAGS